MQHVVKDEKTIESLLAAPDRALGMFLRRDVEASSDRIRSIDEVYNVGTLGQIQQMVRNSMGLQLTVLGIQRIEIKEIWSTGPPVVAQIFLNRNIKVLNQTNEIKAYVNELRQATR
jgi:ATP-dependent Lon protease